MFDYREVYKSEVFNHFDGIQSWNNKKLKFGDAFAAICYAHDITWEDMVKEFPDCCLKVYDGHPESSAMNENTKYTINEQVDFIKKNRKRIPKKILEIGGGRGEVTCFLSYLGYDVVSIEVCTGAQSWYDRTSENFFEKKLNYCLLNGSVTDFISNENIKNVDTIIMVESLEHILENDFNNIYYNRLLPELKENKGRFIVVNWKHYHPIAVGQYAPPNIHCRLTDDNLYDSMVREIGTCIYRDGSHICIDAI